MRFLLSAMKYCRTPDVFRLVEEPSGIFPVRQNDRSGMTIIKPNSSNQEESVVRA